MYARIPDKGSFEFRSVTSADSSASFVVDHIEEENSYHQTVSPQETKKGTYSSEYDQMKENVVLDSPKHSIFKYALFFVAGSLITSLVYRLTSETNTDPFRLGKKTYSCSLSNMEGPFLYITQHSGSGILKYSMDGCYRGNKVLKGGEMRKVQLRSMFVGSFQGSEALIVADSDHSNSRVVMYGPCMNSTLGSDDDDQSNDDTKEKLLDDDADDSMETTLLSEETFGRRQYIIDVIDEKGFPYNTRRGPTHPYGIAQDKHGNIYASFQDTDSVLRFKYDPSAPYAEIAASYIKDKTVPGSFVPMKLPPGLPKLHDKDHYYNGTFVQFGSPKTVGGIVDMGIRAIIFVEGNLWVADEDNGVTIFNSDGYEIGHIKMEKPVGLAYSINHRVVFISSRKGKVKAYLISGKFKHAFDVPDPDKLVKLKHPVGMAIKGHKLFIADQHYGQVYEYDITRNAYERTIITGLDRVEQMAISDC